MMKYRITLFCFSLSLAMLPLSCEKGPWGSPAAKLPPITCEGKGTFGCLLNGEVYLPDGWDNPFSLQYEIRDNPHKGTFRLVARSSERKMVWLQLNNQVFDTGYYKLGFDDFSMGYARFSTIKDQLFEYFCYSQMYGELHISMIDTVNDIMCGTFAFDAVNRDNELDTVRIRDARFDAEFLY